MKIKIESDVYNISKRIKSIDKGYYVVYDTTTSKFEIHNKSQKGSSYCLTLPFNQLDDRTLKRVRSTMSSNIDEIIYNLENDNKILESANKTSAFSNIVDSFEQNLKSL